MSLLDMDVSKLIQQKMCLEILRKALEWDQQQLKSTKMHHVYDLLLDQTIVQMSDDLRDIKQQLHGHNARIIQEEQREIDRRVVYNHKGYIWEDEFPNQLIKVTCEELLRAYLDLGQKGTK